MINFITIFAEFLSKAGLFLTGLLTGAVQINLVITSVFINLPQYFSWLPIPVFGLLTSTFVVVVIYKILGRD